MSKPGADNRKVFQGASHRYVVLKPLGSGGMGSTWVVFDHRMGDLKQFAIKILDPKLARSDPRAREHFVHEARATAALDHPNIVSVMWIDELSDGTPLYAMELLNGESVGAALKRGPIPVQEGLNIVLDVLDGLHFAHKHALVHQDIKPSNVVLHRNARGESVAKIIDFGVVRTADDGDRGFAGTFAYAAPEQIRGGKIGPATDIFGAGALLFEILTGSRPFAGYPSNLTGAVARLDSRPPSILSFGRFTDELADLVSRALAPRAEDRPETAKAFGLELRKIARELASPTPKPEHISQVGRPILRGALADTTDQTGIEYEEIIARAHAGAAEPLSVGASDTLDAPMLPVAPAAAAAPVLNDVNADTHPERRRQLATEPLRRAPVEVPPISQLVTDPPSRVIAAVPNVRPIYIDRSIDARGSSDRASVGRGGNPVRPMPMMSASAAVSAAPRSAVASSDRALAAAARMTLAAAPSSITPTQPSLVEGAAAVAIARSLPLLPSSAPPPDAASERGPKRVESGVETRSQTRAPATGASVLWHALATRPEVPPARRTVPMHRGCVAPVEIVAPNKVRYSPLEIQLRRFYQSRTVRIGAKLLTALILSAAASSITFRYMTGTWPWGLTASSRSTSGGSR